MFCNGPLHMDVLVLADPQRHFASTLYKGCNLVDLPGVIDDGDRWRECRNSVLPVQLDDIEFA